MEPALPPLSDSEHNVIKMRNGLADGYSRSIEEVGRILDLAPDCVREIEITAIETLKSLRTRWE
jgi:RNA polymerase primary sigma factor